LCKIAAANSQASHCIEARTLSVSGLDGTRSPHHSLAAGRVRQAIRRPIGRYQIGKSGSPKSSPLLPSTGIRFGVFSKTRIRLGRQRSWYPSRNQTKTLPIDAMTDAQFEIRIDGTPRSYRDRKDYAMEAARLIKNREPVGYTAVYPEPAASNLQRRWNGSL
jgi:hypothetical protein